MRAILKDGFGAQLGLISFSQLYSKKYPKEEQHLYFICSDPVWATLDFFLKDLDRNIQYYHYNDLTNDLALARELKERFLPEDIYVLTPDLVGNEEFTINNSLINWREIQTRQCLKYLERPENNNVFLNLLTAQPNNDYNFSKYLISKLCNQNPEFDFYYSDVKMWGDKDISLDLNLEELAARHSNFIIRHPKSLAEDIEWITYNINSFITLDSGIGNLAYRLGRERILLDSRYGNLAFEIRWRGTTKDSIPIGTSPASVSRLFNLLQKNPELTILNKYDILTRDENQLFADIGYKTKLGFNK